MTPTGDPGSRAVVTPLRRPPVRQSVLVRAPLQDTFEAFVRTIGIWWPVQPFSAGKERVRDITLEQREGGRVYEKWDDGTEAVWGELLTWSPPDRFVMTWQGTPAPTEVELSFTALGPELTRVAVEHRGWEALTEEQLGEDCALPGGYSSGGYAIGWTRILGCFAATLGAEPALSTEPAPGTESTFRTEPTLGTEPTPGTDSTLGTEPAREQGTPDER